jgi:hypothetical protein
LDGRWFLKTGFEYAHEELPAEEHVLEFGAFGCSDIFCLGTKILWWWVKACFP